jgi:hypothetical protein
MSKQPQKQDLTPTMQELIAQLAQMKAELNELKARANAVATPPVQQVQPGMPPSSQTAELPNKLTLLPAFLIFCWR